MPIHQHLTDKTAFGPAAIEAMSKAFEEACTALQVYAGDEKGREIIATRIIDLARGGLIDPTALRDRVIAEVRLADTRTSITLAERSDLRPGCPAGDNGCRPSVGCGHLDDRVNFGRTNNAGCLLPAITVRYCFRTLADATAFKRRFLCVGKASCRWEHAITRIYLD